MTILGAIGESLPKAVFTLAPTTNREHVIEFFRKLRSTVDPNPMLARSKQQKLVVVLDNHRAHYGPDVEQLAKQLNMELLFLPPYSPELNSIESLWSIVKGKIKLRLISSSHKTLTQQDFEAIMQSCLDQITPAQQKQAARYNNREFIHRMITEYLSPPVRSEEEALRSVNQLRNQQRRLNARIRPPAPLEEAKQGAGGRGRGRGRGGGRGRSRGDVQVEGNDDDEDDADADADDDDDDDDDGDGDGDGDGEVMVMMMMMMMMDDG